VLVSVYATSGFLAAVGGVLLFFDQWQGGQRARSG
jgi:ribose/xylose/arabinose/galactoside ABC-type transport system permease subunit